MTLTLYPGTFNYFNTSGILYFFGITSEEVVLQIRKLGIVFMTEIFGQTDIIKNFDSFRIAFFDKVGNVSLCKIKKIIVTAHLTGIFIYIILKRECYDDVFCIFKNCRNCLNLNRCKTGKAVKDKYALCYLFGQVNTLDKHIEYSFVGYVFIFAFLQKSFVK